VSVAQQAATYVILYQLTFAIPAYLIFICKDQIVLQRAQICFSIWTRLIGNAK
jgi:hypothetical protein